MNLNIKESKSNNEKKNIQLLCYTNKTINFLNNASNQILAIYLKNNENFESMKKNDKNDIISIVEKIKFYFTSDIELCNIFKLYFNHLKWNSNYYYFTVKKNKNIITIIEPENNDDIIYKTKFKHSYQLSTIFERVLYEYNFDRLFENIENIE